jgi:hypothetical protein
MESQNDQNLKATTTKPSLMKRTYDLGASIIGITILFWLVYTVIFLFVDGWHTTAINPIEKMLDLITSISWNVGLFLILVPMGIKLGEIVRREN